jgi:hypothetical protein
MKYADTQRNASSHYAFVMHCVQRAYNAPADRFSQFSFIFTLLTFIYILLLLFSIYYMLILIYFFPFSSLNHNFDLYRWNNNNNYYYLSYINCPGFVCCLFVCLFVYIHVSLSSLFFSFFLTRADLVIGLWAVKSARR